MRLQNTRPATPKTSSEPASIPRSEQTSSPLNDLALCPGPVVRALFVAATRGGQRGQEGIETRGILPEAVLSNHPVESRRPLPAPLVDQQALRVRWWAHKGSNLGPAD